MDYLTLLIYGMICQKYCLTKEQNICSELFCNKLRFKNNIELHLYYKNIKSAPLALYMKDYCTLILKVMTSKASSILSRKLSPWKQSVRQTVNNRRMKTARFGVTLNGSHTQCWQTRPNKTNEIFPHTARYYSLYDTKYKSHYFRS